MTGRRHPNHVYTAEQLRDPTGRPSVGPRAVRVRVFRRNRHGGGVTYATPTPCCGRVTQVPEWSVLQLLAGQDVKSTFECGKPWLHQRGNPRGAGCRAVYRVEVEQPPPGQQHPQVFRLRWTGR